MMSQRWEQLISQRASIDQIEVLTWNDYGESSYIGPIAGDMPSEAKAFATSAFPHTDILSLNAFYAQAWKSGAYPTITQDKAWIMARPHPANASPYGDSIGAPSNRGWTQDNFYVQVHLVGSAQVTLCAGSNCKSSTGSPGINRFSQPMTTGQGISVKIVRNGQTTVNLAPSFTFDGNPRIYNFSTSHLLHTCWFSLTPRLPYQVVVITDHRHTVRHSLFTHCLFCRPCPTNLCPAILVHLALSSLSPRYLVNFIFRLATQRHHV